MKKPTVAIACLALVAAAYADGPTLFVYGPGGSPGGSVFDDACWQQDYDTDGSRVSCEQILEFEMESFLANDFGVMCEEAVEITKVIWWGGEWEWTSGDPEIEVFNLYFYTDNGDCVPEAVIMSYLGVTPVRIFLGYTGGGLLLYQYEYDVRLAISGDTRYWFCAQADDHTCPPQWGIQEAVGPVLGCESMFRSDDFDYYDWTPASIVLGYEFEGAFAIECIWSAAADATTWGAVKALFR